MNRPIIGEELQSLVGRSFGASIQFVRGNRARRLAARLKAPPPASDRITHALLILKEPLDRILSGAKTWEIRGRSTERRGRIALVESKSGHVVGTAELVGVVGPMTLEHLRKNSARAQFRPQELPYRTTFAWVMRNAKRLPEPVPYRHPSGAVIWVKLEPSAIRAVNRGVGAR